MCSDLGYSIKDVFHLPTTFGLDNKSFFPITADTKNRKRTSAAVNLISNVIHLKYIFYKGMFMSGNTHTHAHAPTHTMMAATLTSLRNNFLSMRGNVLLRFDPLACHSAELMRRVLY